MSEDFDGRDSEETFGIFKLFARRQCHVTSWGLSVLESYISNKEIGKQQHMTLEMQMSRCFVNGPLRYHS